MTRPRRGPALVAAAVLAALLAAVAGACGRPGGPAPRVAAASAVTAGVVTVQADPGVSATSADEVRGDVAAAVAPVAALLPGGWTRRVAVTLVGSDTRLRAEAGWETDSAQPAGTVAAVAVLPISGAAPTSSPSASADGRLVVDLAVYQRLTTAGRRIVLRHELTHLATAAVTPAGMPVWLVEGFAEEVGHEGVVACSATFGPVPGGPGCPAGATAGALPVTAAAGELAAEVRAGRVPTGLPDDAEFTGSDGRLAQTYEESWLACRLLATRLGLPGLARFYRDVAARLTPAPAGGGGVASPTGGSGRVSGATAVAAAVPADTGMSWSAFVAAWRSSLAALLGSPGQR